jgi:ABC-type maltose transport system permease subunit
VVEVVAIIRGCIKEGWKACAAATVLLTLQIGVMFFQYWMVQGV